MAYRDSPFQALKAPLTLTAGAVALVAGLGALGLFLTDHRGASDSNPYGPVRGEFDEVMEPVTNVLSAPLHWIHSAADYAGDYVFAINQNRQLKLQVQELKRWRDAAIALKNLNLRYEALLKLRTEPPIAMVTGRVVSDVHGPFSDSRLIDVGSEAGVRIGNPALGEDGVVGRVVGVARNASRILLLSDVESRTPVLIDRSNARAILTGDGGAAPKLEFVHGADAIREGDVVLTSGDGGVYPRGLPVGVAARDFRGLWRVRLYADRTAVDFVRVLLFNGFASSVDQAALARTDVPPLTPEEEAQNAQARLLNSRPPSSAAQPAAGQPAPPPAVSGARPVAPTQGAPHRSADVSPPPPEGPR